MIPVTISLALFLRYGTEIRGFDLRHLDQLTSVAGTARIRPTTLETVHRREGFNISGASAGQTVAPRTCT